MFVLKYENKRILFLYTLQIGYVSIVMRLMFKNIYDSEDINVFCERYKTNQTKHSIFKKKKDQLHRRASDA